MPRLERVLGTVTEWSGGRGKVESQVVEEAEMVGKGGVVGGWREREVVAGDPK